MEEGRLIDCGRYYGCFGLMDVRCSGWQVSRGNYNPELTITYKNKVIFLE